MHLHNLSIEIKQHNKSEILPREVLYQRLQTHESAGKINFLTMVLLLELYVIWKNQSIDGVNECSFNKRKSIKGLQNTTGNAPLLMKVGMTSLSSFHLEKATYADGANRSVVSKNIIQLFIQIFYSLSPWKM